MKAPTSIEYGNLMKLRVLVDGDTFKQYFTNRDNYDNFLSQKPELWQFVPCDADGVPIVEPKPIHTYGLEVEDYEYDDNEIATYQQALSKVVFNGWEVKRIQGSVFFLESDFAEIIFWEYNNGNVLVDFIDLSKEKPQTVRIHTLESLIPFGIELTDEKAREFKLI